PQSVLPNQRASRFQVPTQAGRSCNQAAHGRTAWPAHCRGNRCRHRSLCRLPGLTTNTKSDGIGIVGFCIGGLIAFRAAASRPDRVKVAVSFHGGGLYKANDPKSAHLGLPKIKARLYFGHAVEDNSMPAEAIAKLEEALQSWGGQYESEIYEGTRHGWTMPDNASYNQLQAERAFARLKSVFKESLG